MRLIGPFILIFFIFLCSQPKVEAHSINLKTQEVTTLESMLADLKQVRAVFIGEVHDRSAHHRAQLQLIQELHKAGVEIGIGLEMFRQDGQADLDLWVAGITNESQFRKVYHRHWGMWQIYREIFVYARENRIPLIGLNISRKIVSLVARKGFDSLSNKERRKLPLVVCDVSPEYRAFIRRALEGHGENGIAFENFCEAQMLWDASMARTLQEYLEKHPQRLVVVLAGNGHSWKHGIPDQLVRLGDYSYRVLLPEVPGRIDLQTIDYDDADYLLQGVELAPLH